MLVITRGYSHFFGRMAQPNWSSWKMFCFTRHETCVQLCRCAAELPVRRSQWQGSNMVRPTISVPFLLEMVEIIWSSNFLEIFEVCTWSWRKLRKLTQLRPFDLPLHGTSWNPSGCLDLRGRNLIFIFEFKSIQVTSFLWPTWCGKAREGLWHYQSSSHQPIAELEGRIFVGGVTVSIIGHGKYIALYMNIPQYSK